MLEIDVIVIILVAIFAFNYEPILGFAVLLMLSGYLTSKLIEASKKISSLSEELRREDSRVGSESGS